MACLSSRVAQFELKSHHVDLARKSPYELSKALADVRHVLGDRSHGIAVLRASTLGLDKGEFPAFQEKLSAALGPVLPEIGESGRLFRLLTGEGDGTEKGKLSEFRLHTDAPYHNPVPDWVALGKLEDNTESRSVLLNIHDWSDLSRLSNDARSHAAINWREPDFFGVEERSHFSNLGIEIGVSAPVFEGEPERPRIRFRFRPYDNMHRQSAICSPETVEYLEEIAASLASSAGTCEVSLGISDVLVFNNHFVLHGRTATTSTHPFRRILVRTRGFLKS